MIGTVTEKRYLAVKLGQSLIRQGYVVSEIGEVLWMDDLVRENLEKYWSEFNSGKLVESGERIGQNATDGHSQSGT